MNNKGFGLVNILAFSVFAILAIVIFYAFTTSIMGFIPKTHIPDYTNEYAKYFKSAITTEPTLMANNTVQSYTSYKQIEDALSNATAKYISDYYSTIYEDDPLYIKVTTLVKDGYLNEIKDISDSSVVCTGYNEVLKSNNNITFTSYIKCGDNYKTAGYTARLDG